MWTEKTTCWGVKVIGESNSADIEDVEALCTLMWTKKARDVRNLNSDVVNVSADIEDVEAK